MSERRVDLLIGIPLGIVLGIAILAAFLFVGSEETIDAARISGVDSGVPAKVRPAEDGRTLLHPEDRR